MRIPYQFSRMVEQVIQRTVVSGAAPAGVIASYGGSTAPGGWLLCDGTAVNRFTYAALFTAIGTTYGAGDGSTTFNVPNLKGRVPVGLNASDGTFSTLNNTGGAKTVTLATTDIPALTGTVSSESAHTHGSTGAGTAHGHTAQSAGSHTHDIGNLGSGGALPGIPDTGTAPAVTLATQSGGSHTHTTDNESAHTHSTGAGSSHTHTVTTPAATTNPSVLQPYIVVNFIIKV